MNGRFGPSRAPPPIRTNSRWMDRFWTGGGREMVRSVRSIRLLVHPYL